MTQKRTRKSGAAMLAADVVDPLAVARAVVAACEDGVESGDLAKAIARTAKMQQAGAEAARANGHKADACRSEVIAAARNVLDALAFEAGYMAACGLNGGHGG